MTTIPDRTTFETAYAGQAPWDIGRPQKAFLDAADRITCSVLDAGCGTGENALYFAGRGHKVTGIDYLEEPIRRAKRKAEERGISATFLVQDATASGPLPRLVGRLPGIVPPWRAQSAFIAAIGQVHARLVRATDLTA